MCRLRLWRAGEGGSMSDARLVVVGGADHLILRHIRDACPAYRVATEAFIIATDSGCDEQTRAALWALCQREHDQYAASVIEGRS